SFQADKDPTNCALMAYISSGSSRSSGSDNERGFDSQVFNSQVSDCEELHSYESDNRVPKNPENDRYKIGEGYHVVPHLYTDDPNASKSVANMFNVESSTNKPSKYMYKTHRPDASIVEDWISDSEDETEIEFLRFALAFWTLRFGPAFWFCVLLIEDISCVLPRKDSAHFKTWLRFSQDFLHFVSRPPAFCLKTYCILSQDFLRFVSRLPAFCLKASCVLSTFEDLLCVLVERNSGKFFFITTDFALWQQRIRLYCRGKENRVNILKSIDEGPFQMGTVWGPLAKGTKGVPHLGPERPRVYFDLSPEEKDRVDRIEDRGPIHGVEVQLGHVARNCTQPKRLQNSDYYKGKMLLMQAQENRVALDEEQLLFLAGGQDNAIDEDVDEQSIQDLSFNVDNVFQADDCDAFDSDVDEASTTQTMFMVNMSTADPVYDEAGPSYDSNILSEVHDHDHYQDAVCENHEEHAMHENVQLNHVVASHADYTSDSNMIMYDQYVKDNVVPGVHSNVSSIPNDAYMMIYNDMYEPHA
nr:hypothetical protein [Tanacetum cinerariifolium]